MFAALGEVAKLHQHLIKGLRSQSVREPQVHDTSYVRDTKHGGADLLLILAFLCVILLVLVLKVEDAHQSGKRCVVLLAGVAFLDLHAISSEQTLAESRNITDFGKYVGGHDEADGSSTSSCG